MLRIIYRRIRSYLSNEAKLEDGELGGQVLKVKKGTIRKAPDMDDAWFAHLAMKSNIILDIGTNVGYDALVACVFGKPERIVMVDPNPHALSAAARNMIMNGFSRKCQFVLALVSDSDGEKVKFYTHGTGAAGSIYSGFANSARRLNSWYWVNTETLDNLAKSLQLAPNLIKIDVEGAESKVLRGARELCARYKPQIIVEMHSGPELSMRNNAEAILAWCSDSDYQAWYLKDACRLEKPEKIAHRGRCHLLLIPEGQEYPSELKSVAQRAPLPNR